MKLIPLTQLRETDLQIKDAPVAGKDLREALKRLFSSLNPYFDGINKLAAKGVTLADNLKCDLVSGKFTHGVAQNVALHTLTKAGSALVLGADGQLAVAITVQSVQQVSGRTQAQVTIWFNDSTAASVPCVVLLLPEGQISGSTPTFLEAIPKSLLTTVGDMIYASAAKTPARLAVGGTGALLYVTGGIPAWLAASTNGQLLTLASGAPAWAGETTWTALTLTNSWVDLDTVNYLPAGVLKDASGVVHLRGVVKNGTLNTSVTTLAAAYRPSKRANFVVWNNTGACVVEVRPDGTVVQIAGINNLDLQLNGITFDTR